MCPWRIALAVFLFTAVMPQLGRTSVKAPTTCDYDVAVNGRWLASPAKKNCLSSGVYDSWLCSLFTAVMPQLGRTSVNAPTVSYLCGGFLSDRDHESDCPVTDHECPECVFFVGVITMV